LSALSLKTLPVLFSTYSSCVPVIGTYFGAPSVTMSSVGAVATMIAGTVLARVGAG
jgi:hypothetical protein